MILWGGLGLVVALLLVASYLLIRGGQDLRTREPRLPADRVKRRDW